MRKSSTHQHHTTQHSFCEVTLLSFWVVDSHRYANMIDCRRSILLSFCSCEIRMEGSPVTAGPEGCRVASIRMTTRVYSCLKRIRTIYTVHFTKGLNNRAKGRRTINRRLTPFFMINKEEGRQSSWNSKFQENPLYGPKVVTDLR